MRTQSKLHRFLAVTKLASVTLALFIGLLSSTTMNAYADASTPSDETSSSPDIANVIKTAKRLIKKKQYAAAIKGLTDTAEKEKDNADIWNLIGYASRKSGDMEAASVAYNKALKINKDHLGALEYQGELFIAMGNIADAKINLERLSELCQWGCEERKDLEAAIAAAN